MPLEYEEYKPEKKPGHLRQIIGLAIFVPILLLVIAVWTGALPIKYVASGSMEPTLQIGDRVLIDGSKLPDRFDIIAFRDPTVESGGDWYIKRIVGLPGDKVEIRSGILYINGELQYSEKIHGNRINWDNIRVEVPLDTVYVLGDNRNDSYDSLNFGPIPDAKVVGVMSVILWPPARWGKVRAFKE